MTAFLNVITSSSCPSCKVCVPIVQRVSHKFPDVIVQFWDEGDPMVSRFQDRNLKLSVESIKDANLRQKYLDEGITEMSGLPAFFISSDVQPLRILDMAIGCVSRESSFIAKKKMREDFVKMFQKVEKLNKEMSLTSVGRNQRRRDDYGF